MKSTISKNLRGYVRVSNEAGQVVESNNLVVYRGADILTALLAGKPEYKISHMYFVYENTAGTPAPYTPARTDTAALFHGLVAPRDFIRAQVLTPVISTSGANYLGNQATFAAIAQASAGVHGVSFGAGSNSKVFSLGIVAAPTGAYAGDYLYAHYSLPTALPAVGSGQISASWMLEAD